VPPALAVPLRRSRVGRTNNHPLLLAAGSSSARPSLYFSVSYSCPPRAPREPRPIPRLVSPTHPAARPSISSLTSPPLFLFPRFARGYQVLRTAPVSRGMFFMIASTGSPTFSRCPLFFLFPSTVFPTAFPVCYTQFPVCLAVVQLTLSQPLL